MGYLAPPESIAHNGPSVTGQACVAVKGREHVRFASRHWRQTSSASHIRQSFLTGRCAARHCLFPEWLADWRDVRPRSPAAGRLRLLRRLRLHQIRRLLQVASAAAEPDEKAIKEKAREENRERFQDWCWSLPLERRNQVDRSIARRRVGKWRENGLLSESEAARIRQLVDTSRELGGDHRLARFLASALCCVRGPTPVLRHNSKRPFRLAERCQCELST